MLAEQGADIAINYHASRDRAEAVAAEVRELGRRAEVYQADIRVFDDCQRMTSQALADFGKVDILVNSAGIGYETYGTPLLTELDPADLQQFIDYNTFGRSLHVQAAGAADALAAARRRHHGVVLLRPGLRVRMGAYSVSKAGMEAIAFVLAKEEREHGIRVNIVAPGLVDTDMGAGFLGSIGATREDYTRGTRPSASSASPATSPAPSSTSAPTRGAT